MDAVNPKTQMTHDEARSFVRAHFEEFINRKNIAIGEVNFSEDYVDHGADIPAGLPPGRTGTIQYVATLMKRFPDVQVEIQDMVAEDDRVVCRNQWTATDATNGQRMMFRGIVIWRIRNRQLVERWAYLEPPRTL